MLWLGQSEPTDVVKAGDGATDSSVILETSLHPSVDRPALYLSDLHLESSLEVPGGDEGDGGGRVARPGVNVHVVSSVAATDDRHRGSSSHHEPEADLGGDQQGDGGHQPV